MKEKYVLSASCVGIGCNVALFFVKLYIGLAVNSISIFSDAINNLADSLSCILAVACMAVALKNSKNGLKYVNSKIEQILSFVLSVIVVIVGFSFLYSSLERLMYPTPIFYSTVYFGVIAGTVAVKIFMAIFYTAQIKKTGSSVMKIMRADSILDACVTSITLISFVLINYLEFAVDAIAGIVISIIIMAESGKLVKSSVFGLINYVSKEKRIGLEKELSSCGKIKMLNYNRFDEDRIVCYVQFEEVADTSLIKEIGNKHKIEIYTVNS